MATPINATTNAYPSHDALQVSRPSTDSSEETAEAKLAREAMEGAKRAQNRIKDNETKIPGDSIFTK